MSECSSLNFQVPKRDYWKESLVQEERKSRNRNVYQCGLAGNQNGQRFTY